MDQVAQSIVQFEADARAAGVPPEQINAAKYALAATADDIVQNLPSDDRHLWTQYSMLVRFFGERTGGVKFFQELERAKQNPAVNLGLLELMHACLCLGFEGVYRASTSAAAPARCKASAATSMKRSAARSPRRSKICRRIGAARRSASSPIVSVCRSGRSPPWRA